MFFIDECFLHVWCVLALAVCRNQSECSGASKSSVNNAKCPAINLVNKDSFKTLILHNYFNKGKICGIYLHDMGEIKIIYIFSAEMSGFLTNMSGILDPSIPPFKRSVVQL